MSTSGATQIRAISVPWMPPAAAAIQAMYQHVGLTGNSPLEARVHKLFLPVG